MESILTSIKTMLGPTAEYTHFDPELIMHINSVFTDLHQLGVGPAEGFFIEDDSAVWTDFIPDMRKLQSVKTYMYLRVKLIFDNSTLSSSVIASMERQIKEFEWRLNVAVDPVETNSEPFPEPTPDPTPEPTPDPPSTIDGIVSNCEVLNIRAQPNKDAKVIAVISVGSKVKVDPVELDGWYSIWLESGVNGFCMKDYITIKP